MKKLITILALAVSTAIASAVPITYNIGGRITSFELFTAPHYPPDFEEKALKDFPSLRNAARFNGTVTYDPAKAKLVRPGLWGNPFPSWVVPVETSIKIGRYTFFLHDDWRFSISNDVQPGNHSFPTGSDIVTFTNLDVRSDGDNNTENLRLDPHLTTLQFVDPSGTATNGGGDGFLGFLDGVDLSLASDGLWRWVGYGFNLNTSDIYARIDFEINGAIDKVVRASVPDAGSTLLLLGLGFAAIVGIHQRRTLTS
jgi:hypothetical protein